VLEELKAKARKLGLWNMFLPKNHFSQGAGFSNLEYGLMAEYLGKSKLASEVSDSRRIIAKSDEWGADG
jgi:acyl-CoA dehydrogenase